MLERILRVADLHDADELDHNTWADSTPLERLAAVEAIRRATLALYGTSVRGVERILVVADAPSSALRRPKDLADLVMLGVDPPSPRLRAKRTPRR